MVSDLQKEIDYIKKDSLKRIAFNFRKVNEHEQVIQTKTAELEDITEWLKRLDG